MSFDNRTPLWFKLWFAFCAVFAVSFAGFVIWAIYSLVVWVTAK